MKIEPERLKKLRERKSWSRQVLADKSKLNPRTIQRLESEAGRQDSTREETARKLATILEVEPGVLTGTLPFPNEELSSESAKRHLDRQRFSVEISTAARNAYELIRIQYGIQPTALAEMAPLFFVLLAEASLADRRKKLEELETAIVHLENVAQGHLIFAYPSMVDNGLMDEDASIAQKDLFGSEITDDVYNFGYSYWRDNPFACFLRNLAETLNDPSQVLVSDMENIYADNLPDYIVCKELVRQLADEDSELETALMEGFVPLSEMPARLRGNDAAKERLSWLRERYAKWQAELDEAKNGPSLLERLGLTPGTLRQGESERR